MSFIPEEIITNLNVFNSIQDRSTASIPSYKSKERIVRPPNPKKRSIQIKKDQRQASHKRQVKEMQRPKMILEDQIVNSTKPASYYLEQARLRYLSKQQVVRPSSIVAKRRCKSMLDKSESVALPSKINSIYPDWLVNKADFLTSPQKFKELVQSDLVSIVNASYIQRSEEEKEALFEWVSGTSFFKNKLRQIIMESCDRISCKQYKKGQTVSPKGIVEIIYLGKVGRYQGDTLLDSLASKDCIQKSTEFLYKAEEDVLVFELSSHHYENILIGLKKIDKSENTAFLSSVRYFQDWSHLKVQRLSNVVYSQSYKKGEAVFDLGEESDICFILKKGKVQIQVYADVNQQNKWPVSSKEWKIREINRKYIVTLATLGPRKIFGEIDLIEGSLRQSRAIAVEASECLQIKKSDFFEIFSNKDTERLVEAESVIVPNGKELKKKILKEIEDKSLQEKALLDAMKIDYSNSVGREHDQRSKKLNNWLVDLQNRRQKSMNDFKKKVIQEYRKVIKVKHVS